MASSDSMDVIRIKASAKSITSDLDRNVRARLDWCGYRIRRNCGAAFPHSFPDLKTSWLYR
jgi:hypothetical protein